MEKGEADSTRWTWRQSTQQARGNVGLEIAGVGELCNVA